MTTATRYSIKAATIRELTHLSRRTQEELRLYTTGITHQDVIDELHERALFAYHASTQGLDDLVRVITYAHQGTLATFTGARLIRALGVLADMADAQDWRELAALKLTRDAVLDSLHELALRGSP